jgi:hypothetical protein
MGRIPSGWYAPHERALFGTGSYDAGVGFGASAGSSPRPAVGGGRRAAQREAGPESGALLVVALGFRDDLPGGAAEATAG